MMLVSAHKVIIHSYSATLSQTQPLNRSVNRRFALTFRNDSIESVTRKGSKCDRDGFVTDRISVKAKRPDLSGGTFWVKAE